MTVDRDLERLLDTWLADGVTVAPDRVLSAAVDRIDRQRQRPAWRLLWRDFHVFTTAKMAAISVAILIISVLGAAIVLRPGGGSSVAGPGSTSVPSLAATPSPTPSPSPSPSPTIRNVGMSVQGKRVTWTADMPVGWTGVGSWFMTKSQGTSGPTGIAVAAPGGTNVPSNPCDGIGKVSTYKTPADVVAALKSRKDFVVSKTTATTLGGYAGLRVDVQAPADLGACGSDPFSYFLFAEPDGSGVSIQGPSQLTRMWILDVEGQPIVFQIQSFPGTPAADLAEAQQIVDSIVVQP